MKWGEFVDIMAIVSKLECEHEYNKIHDFLADILIEKKLIEMVKEE